MHKKCRRQCLLNCLHVSIALHLPVSECIDYFGVFIEVYVGPPRSVVVSVSYISHHNIWCQVVLQDIQYMLVSSKFKVSISSPSFVTLDLPVSEKATCLARGCLLFLQ